MARYSRKIPGSAETAWDGKVNDNFQNIFDRPIPLYFHNDTLADLQSTFAAGSYDHTLAWALYKTAGSGDVPIASDASAYRLLSNWTFMRKLRQEASTTYAVDADDMIVVTTGASSFDVDLEALAAANEGRELLVFHEGTGTITIDPNGSDTINGASNLQLTSQYSGVLLVSNGAGDWHAFTFGAAGTPTESLIVAASDETTVLTTGTGKVTFRMPYAFTLSEVRASLTTASTTGTVTVDINESGSTILSTKLTIDATEKTSETAATAPVISDTSLADDAEITIDIDDAGSSADAAGLKIYLIGTRG